MVKCTLQCINQIVAARLHAIDATSARRLPPQDEDVIEFIVKCPLPELQDLLNPELLDKALSEMDTDDDGTISKDEWTEAVGKSLTKLLDERQKDRDADNEFAIDFQTKAREVFEMIDADDSWTLDKEELMAGINQKRVSRFLISCGNEHLQYLCVPARLGPMLWELDTSKDGIISLDEWDSAIAIALDKKLEQRAAARNRDKKVAADQRLAEAFDMNADSLEAVRDRKLAEAEGRIDEDGNIISQEEMDRRAEEAEIARLKAIPRQRWGMPLSNRSSLLCAIVPRLCESTYYTRPRPPRSCRPRSAGRRAPAARGRWSTARSPSRRTRRRGRAGRRPARRRRPRRSPKRRDTARAARRRRGQKRRGERAGDVAARPRARPRPGRGRPAPRRPPPPRRRGPIGPSRATRPRRRRRAFAAIESRGNDLPPRRREQGRRRERREAARRARDAHAP